jgi:hypothetical protein
MNHRHHRQREDGAGGIAAVKAMQRVCNPGPRLGTKYHHRALFRPGIT